MSDQQWHMKRIGKSGDGKSEPHHSTWQEGMKEQTGMSGSGKTTVVNRQNSKTKNRPSEPGRFLYPSTDYSAFGRAKETLIARPSIMEPSRASMAACAVASSANSTKPNPRERSVSRSVMTRAETTLPWAEKISLNWASSTPQGREPTNNLLFTIRVTSGSNDPVT